MVSVEKDGDFMHDFMEIMSFHGFDLKKADKAAKEYPPVVYAPELIDEEMNRVGLEKISKQPLREGCG